MSNSTNLAISIPCGPCSEYLSERGVHSPILLVALIEQLHVFGARINSPRHTHCRITRLVHRAPKPRTNTRQQGCAVGGSLFCGDDLHRSAIDIGLDLPPKFRASASASQADVTHRNAQLFEDGEAIAQAKRHASHDLPHNVRTCVRGRTPDQGSARIWIKMRSAFAH